MTCRKVRNFIPLAAGDDLKPRQAAAFRAHIARCPGCRRELEEFRAALVGIRAAAKEQGAGAWGEGEWDAAMGRVRAEAGMAGRAPGRRAGRALGPRWAVASALGAFLGLVVMGLLFRGPSFRPGTAGMAARPAQASEAGDMDKLTMTLVSPESGLQIVWILDKNFDWRGDQE